jgi:hypothetical protein
VRHRLSPLITYTGMPIRQACHTAEKEKRSYPVEATSTGHKGMDASPSSSPSRLAGGRRVWRSSWRRPPARGCAAREPLEPCRFWRCPPPHPLLSGPSPPTA